MRWELHEQLGTLEVTFDEAPPPSREEVEGLLQQVQPLVADVEVRSLFLNGERVKAHQGLSYPEIAGPIRYEAARRRTERTRSLPSARTASVAGDPALQAQRPSRGGPSWEGSKGSPPAQTRKDGSTIS